jgi:hypothetical protein
MRYVVTARFMVIGLFLFFPLAAVDGWAQSSKTNPDVETLIEGTREVLDDTPEGRTAFPVSTRYLDFKRGLVEKHGFTYGVTPTLMLQQGTQGGDNDFTSNEQVHLTANWEPFRKVLPGGSLNFHYMHIGQVTSTTGVDFLQSMGTSFALSDSPADADALRALYWRQEFLEGKVLFAFGHGEIAKNDNGNCRYSCDDTTTFMAAPLSTNPARTLPGAGAAIGVEVFPVPELELALALEDARADNELNFNRVFDEGDLAYSGEIVWRSDLTGVGHGEYRITGFYADEIESINQESSTGVQIGLEQDVGKIGFFLRGGGTRGRHSSVKRYVSGGAVWKGPFSGGPDDWLGLGASWVRPSDSSRSDEGIVEAFYRVQLMPLVQLSPDVMLVLPSGGSDVEAVFNLRLQVQL